MVHGSLGSYDKNTPRPHQPTTIEVAEILRKLQFKQLSPIFQHVGCQMERLHLTLNGREHFRQLLSIGSRQGSFRNLRSLRPIYDRPYGVPRDAAEEANAAVYTAALLEKCPSLEQLKLERLDLFSSSRIGKTLAKLKNLQHLGLR